jgi:hypothetical protein
MFVMIYILELQYVIELLCPTRIVFLCLLHAFLRTVLRHLSAEPWYSEDVNMCLIIVAYIVLKSCPSKSALLTLKTRHNDAISSFYSIQEFYAQRQ